MAMAVCKRQKVATQGRAEHNEVGPGLQVEQVVMAEQAVLRG